jgi:hypothetical protein
MITMKSALKQQVTWLPGKRLNRFLPRFGIILLKSTFDILDSRCRIIVYFIGKDGEIVADALEFEVSGTLTNFVEIFTSRSEQYFHLKLEIHSIP